MIVTVLRESLLKQLDNGAFEPKKLKREKVKEVLLSFRRTLQEIQGVNVPIVNQDSGNESLES